MGARCLKAIRSHSIVPRPRPCHVHVLGLRFSAHQHLYGDPREASLLSLDDLEDTTLYLIRTGQSLVRCYIAAEKEGPFVFSYLIWVEAIYEELQGEAFVDEPMEEENWNALKFEEHAQL